MNDWTGRQLGQYQIIEEIGRGGMAVVYKAWQPALERYVAIKVLPAHFVTDRRFLARFQHEALAAAQLNHPNIVIVHDVGQEGDIHFIVMEHLEGQPLDGLLHTHGALPLARVISIVDQLASALDYAHKQGLVHRDIKPANVIIGRADHATLTDFGIAKAMSGTSLTQTGTMVGTPQYMAPEQVLGAAIDRRADIYALGIVCYEMLAGDPPFTGDTAAVLYAQAHRPPPPLHQRLPRLPSYVESALNQALAKDPTARFASAGQMSAALKTLPATPAPVAPTASPYHTGPPPSTIPPSSASASLRSTPERQPSGQAGGGWTAPPATPSPGGRRATQDRSPQPQIWLLVGGAAAAAFVFIAALLIILLGGRSSDQATPPLVPAATRAVTPSIALTSTSTNTPNPTVPPPTPSEARPDATITPSPTPPPTPTSLPEPPSPPLQLAIALGPPGNADIYLTDAAGSSQRRLVGGSGDQAEPDWAPDEQHIAYHSDQVGNYDIWVTDADGQQRQQLTASKVDERAPDWSPNGQQIVYRRGGEPNGDGELWVMDADGRNQRPLGGQSISGRAPVWSPDGLQVAFMSERGGTWDIYLFDLSSGSVNRFTDCDAHCRFPNWSPDGKYIVYHSTQSASSFTPAQIWRQSADGRGAAELLIEGNNPGRATWSREGLIAFNTDAGIEITNANGTDRHVLRNSDDGWAPDWSR